MHYGFLFDNFQDVRNERINNQRLSDPCLILGTGWTIVRGCIRANGAFVAEAGRCVVNNTQDFRKRKDSLMVKLLNIGVPLILQVNMLHLKRTEHYYCYKCELDVLRTVSQARENSELV
ncbi:unnamed protein product [Natator depressus]